MEVVLEVDELLAGLVDTPVLSRRGVDVGEDPDEPLVEGVCAVVQSRSSSSEGRRIPDAPR